MGQALSGAGFSLWVLLREGVTFQQPNPHRLKPAPLEPYPFSPPYNFSLSTPHSLAIVSPLMTFYQRRLPHWQPPGQEVFITWRLHGSLPKRIPAPKENSSPGEAFVHYDRFLDEARTGPLWLKDSRIAECVLAAMTDAQQKQLIQIRAYALMANHVHVLLTPVVALEQVTHQVKGATARRANIILSRTGTQFWQDESFDHWVRNPAEREKIRIYIECNPVVAGLVARPEDWPWSSASRPIL